MEKLTQQNVGDRKYPERNGNYYEKHKTNDDTKTEAYEANTKRTRKLIHPLEHGVLKKGYNSQSGRASKASTIETPRRRPDERTRDWNLVWELWKAILFELVWSSLILVSVLVRALGKVSEWISPLKENSFLSRDQEKTRKRRKLKKRIRAPLMDHPFQEDHQDSRRSHKRWRSEDIADQTERGPIDSPAKKKLSREPETTSEEDTPIRSTPTDTPTAEPTAPFTMASMQPIRFPMPMPGSEGTPCFSGYNVTEFIERFEDICEEYAVTDKKGKLPKYCDTTHREIVKALPEFEDKAKTWEELVDALKVEFRSDDRHQTTYSISFLSEFVRLQRDNQHLKDYCRQYSSISRFLVDKKVLSEVDQGRLFLLGLPQKCRERTLARHSVDDAKPETYQKFTEFRRTVLEFAQVNRTNQALELQREPTVEYKKEIRELAQEHNQTIKASDDMKKFPPIVPAGIPLVEKAQLDALVQEMENLKIYMSKMGNRRDNDDSMLYPYARTDPKHQEDDPHSNIHTFNVNPLTNVREERCFYCWDTAMGTGVKHLMRDCPDYLRDLAAGVCHINYDRRLCLGPRNSNNRPVNMNWNRCWGEQIRLLTAGTEFDINPHHRPQNSAPVYPQSQTTGPSAGPGVLVPPSGFLSPTQERLAPSGTAPRGPEAPNLVLQGQTLSLFGDNVDRGQFPDDDPHGELLNVNAAAISRSKGGSSPGVFHNPSKITKERLNKEKRYATTRRSLRAANKESGTMRNEDDEEDHDEDADSEETADEEMEKVPLKAKATSRVRKNARFIDEYETLERQVEAFGRLMECNVSMPLKDLVAFKSLPQILNKRRPFVPPTGGDDYQVQDVGVNVQTVGGANVVHNLAEAAAAFDLKTYSGKNESNSLNIMSIQNIAPDTSNVPSLAMHTPKVEVSINSKASARATLDSGAEVNVMSKKLADRAELAIETKKNLVFQGISPGKVFFLGACRRVKVSVGGSVNYVDFLVLDSGTTDLLLGMPYFVETNLNFQYDSDGAVRANLKSGDRRRNVTVTVAGDPIKVAETDSEN